MATEVKCDRCTARITDSKHMRELSLRRGIFDEEQADFHLCRKCEFTVRELLKSAIGIDFKAEKFK